MGRSRREFFKALGLAGAGTALFTPRALAESEQTEGFRPNQWYGPNGSYFTSTGLQDSGVFDLVPWRRPFDCRIIGLAVGVVGASSPGGMVRAMVYADDGDLYPGALLLDSIPRSAESAGSKELETVGSLVYLANTVIWLAGGAQGKPAIRPRMGWYGPGTYFPEMNHGLSAYFVHNGHPPNGYVMGGVEGIPPPVAPQGMGRSSGSVRVAVKLGAI